MMYIAGKCYKIVFIKVQTHAYCLSSASISISHVHILDTYRFMCCHKHIQI